MNNGSQLAISSQSLETISLGGGFSKAVHLIWLSETSVAIFNILQSTTHSTTVCKGTLQQGSNGWIWNFSECRSLGFHILRPIGAFGKIFAKTVSLTSIQKKNCFASRLQDLFIPFGSRIFKKWSVIRISLFQSHVQQRWWASLKERESFLV